LVLGKDWGDKGFPYEKYLIDGLRIEGVNVVALKVSDAADVFVGGMGNVQIKYNDTKVSKNGYFHLMRSSKKEGYGYTWDDEHFENVKHTVIPDNTESKKIHVEERIKESLSSTSQTKYYLHIGDGYRELENLYHLSDLCEDGTLKHKQSFLRKGFYTGSGGKNGNQDHFRIKMKGLMEIIDIGDEFFTKATDI